MKSLLFAFAASLSLAPGVRGQDPDPPEVAAIERAVRDGESRRAFELGALGAKALPALMRLLADRELPDPARYMAANGLGATGLPAAIGPLFAALDDESYNVRRCAAESLGLLHAKTAVPKLRELAAADPFSWFDAQKGERRWLVRESAAKALRMLGEAPPESAPAPAAWVQPEIRTGTVVSDRLPWAATVEDALRRAREQKKPVLATVVAVGDARWSSGFERAAAITAQFGPPPFGDERAAAIDEGLVKERAMMAVLFTDPDIAGIVAEHFVPVRLRVHTYDFDRATNQDGDPLRALGTTGPDCQPPALVVATPDGVLTHACRRMGVFSAPMVRAMLRAALRKTGGPQLPPFRPAPSPKLDDAWAALRAADPARARELLADFGGRERDHEASFLRGLVMDALGDRAAAERAWRGAADADPDGSWGCRAALCLQPRGVVLPQWLSWEAIDCDPLVSTTERAWPAAAANDVVAGAVAWLLAHQRGDGAWPDPFVDPHPMSGPGTQYDLAVPRTAAAAGALLAARPHAASRAKAIDAAVDRAVAFVGAFADAPQPFVWHLTYALELQLDLIARKRGDVATAERRAARLVRAIQQSQQQGGWSYMPPPRTHSFNTALVLRLLLEARVLGVVVDKKVIEAAAVLLEDLRSRDDAREFRYATNVDHKSLKASSCRSALCELALLAADPKRDPATLQRAVELFLEFEPEVRSITKVFESYFAVGPLHDAYHYAFGHAQAAAALPLLPKDVARGLAQRQRDVLLGQVELDGSFVDAQMQGKAASTALSLRALIADLETLAR